MLCYTTTDLARRFRADVNDRITDANGSDFGCLWSDEDVYNYMGDAADAVATRVGTLYKTIQLPFLAGAATVRCPSYVLEIRSARLVNRNQTLVQYNLNDTNYGFRDDYGLQVSGEAGLFNSTGRPTGFVRDFDRQALRFTPTPTEADTLEIQCTTTPTIQMQPDVPMPLMDRKDQLLMLMYMKALAYRKHDAETEDLVRANYWEAKFEAEVRDRESQLRSNRRAPGTIRMEW